jgi:WXG100 family type VII secretion target
MRIHRLVAVVRTSRAWEQTLPVTAKGIAMSIISVDTELLQLKSANVQATVDRISADVQAMKRGLDELQGSWRGSAATNFQALVTEWTLTQGRVEASLASINMALASAAATYAQAEQGNTQRFS